jgi:hypothetical protein
VGTTPVLMRTDGPDSTTPASGSRRYSTAHGRRSMCDRWRWSSCGHCCLARRDRPNGRPATLGYRSVPGPTGLGIVRRASVPGGTVSVLCVRAATAACAPGQVCRSYSRACWQYRQRARRMRGLSHRMLTPRRRQRGQGRKRCIRAGLLHHGLLRRRRAADAAPGDRLAGWVRQARPRSRTGEPNVRRGGRRGTPARGDRRPRELG